MNMCSGAYCIQELLLASHPQLPAYGPLNKGSDSSRQPPPQESFRVRLGPGEGKEDEEIRTLANIMWNFRAAADRSLSPEWFLDSSPFIHPTGHRHRLPTEAELMCDRLIEIWDSDQVSRCPACLFSSFVTSKQEEEQHREWLSVYRHLSSPIEEDILFNIPLPFFSSLKSHLTRSELDLAANIHRGGRRRQQVANSEPIHWPKDRLTRNVQDELSFAKLWGRWTFTWGITLYVIFL